MRCPGFRPTVTRVLTNDRFSVRLHVSVLQQGSFFLWVRSFEQHADIRHLGMEMGMSRVRRGCEAELFFFPASWMKLNIEKLNSIVRMDIFIRLAVRNSLDTLVA